MKFDIDGIIGVGDIKKKKIVEAKIELFKSEAYKEWEKTKFNKVGRVISLCTLIVGVIAYFVCVNHEKLCLKMDTVLFAVAYPWIMYILVSIFKRRDFVKNYVNNKIIEEFDKKDDNNSPATHISM